MEAGGSRSSGGRTGNGEAMPLRGEALPLRGVATSRRRIRLDGRPTISVVIASRGTVSDLEMHLSSLVPECGELGAEVVVARSHIDDEVRRLNVRFPGVRWVECRDESTRFDLRAAGMADAEGDIVTVIEDDQPPTPGRLDHLRSLRQPGETESESGAETMAEMAAQAEWEDEWSRFVPADETPVVRKAARLGPGDHVVIIGAGPGGLTPAYLLAKRGVKVTVLESDTVVGGISRTAQYNGYRFDIGGHRFFTKIRPVEDLWHEILGDEFISVPRLSRIHYEGIFFDYPLKAANALQGLGLLRSFLCVASYGWAHLRPSGEYRARKYARSGPPSGSRTCRSRRRS
jgi:hypothetical protein